MCTLITTQLIVFADLIGNYYIMQTQIKQTALYKVIIQLPFYEKNVFYRTGKLYESRHRFHFPHACYICVTIARNPFIT